jgi:1-acyl-sn-glycerol-3-phosphate acyltransferase
MVGDPGGVRLRYAAPLLEERPMAEGSLSLALLTCFETFRTCAPTVVEAMFGRVPREKSSRRLSEWAARIVRHTGIDLHVHGLEHVDPNGRYVVMSNHQSHYDIFVLFRAYPGVLRMVSKIELSRIPILGGAMTEAEFVFLDRADRRHAHKALRVAAERVRSGINVWIAPEGTQSKDGALLPFKKGGFLLALEAGVPILPVTIEGTRNVLPAKTMHVRHGQRVELTFHAPIDTRAYDHARRDELVARVRDVIDSGLPVENRRRAVESRSHETA